MYADGARYFIELGPNTTLTSYTKEALSEYSDIVAVSLGTSRKDSTTAFLQSVATLWTSGLDLDLEALDALFIERYNTGLASVIKPSSAVPVFSEIPQYNSVGLRDFLTSLPSDVVPPSSGSRSESSSQTVHVQDAACMAVTSDPSSSGAGTTSSSNELADPILAEQDHALGQQLLLEHSRTILTILASAEASSKQIFNQLD